MKTMPNEKPPFQFYIQTIGRGQKRRRSLTQAEARDAMRLILAGEVTEMQLGAFLMLIRVREETPEEAAGFLEAIRENIQAPACAVDIDWGSYAGKRRQLPWFVLALTLLAKRGYKILLHGAVGNESSRLYTETVVAALNWPIADSLNEAKILIESQGFCYLGVEKFAPFMKSLMNTRDELGLRSPMHSLVRMLNPFKAGLSVHGVFHKGYDDIHQATASLLDDPMTAAFCGDGGEAEVRPDRKTEVKMVEHLAYPAGQKTHEHTPADEVTAWTFDLPKTFFDADPTDKCLEIGFLVDVWSGEASHAYGEATVLQTMAMALMILEHLTYAEAIGIATQLWQARNVSSNA